MQRVTVPRTHVPLKYRLGYHPIFNLLLVIAVILLIVYWFGTPNATIFGRQVGWSIPHLLNLPDLLNLKR